MMHEEIGGWLDHRRRAAELHAQAGHARRARAAPRARMNPRLRTNGCATSCSTARAATTTAGAGRSIRACAWAASVRGARAGRPIACRAFRSRCSRCSAPSASRWAGASSPQDLEPLPAARRARRRDARDRPLHPHRAPARDRAARARFPARAQLMRRSLCSTTAFELALHDAARGHGPPLLLLHGLGERSPAARAERARELAGSGARARLHRPRRVDRAQGRRLHRASC